MPSTRAFTPFLLKTLLNAVLNFPRNRRAVSHKQNPGIMTRMTNPEGLTSLSNCARTRFISPVQFRPAKLEKIRSYGPLLFNVCRSVKEQHSAVTLFCRPRDATFALSTSNMPDDISVACTWCPCSANQTASSPVPLFNSRILLLAGSHAVTRSLTRLRLYCMMLFPEKLSSKIPDCLLNAAATYCSFLFIRLNPELHLFATGLIFSFQKMQPVYNTVPIKLFSVRRIYRLLDA